MTLEQIVVELRDLSRELIKLTEALAVYELQTNISKDCREAARRFLSQPISPEDRLRIRENTGICLDECSRKEALVILLREASSQ